MEEPDTTRLTKKELDDTARRIDVANDPHRAARLTAEIERRRALRDHVFTQGAMFGGIAGAFSFPISYAISSAFYQSANRQRIPPDIFYDPFYALLTIPLGWFLGVAAGVGWAALRVRREETELNAVEVWRDALAASVAGALLGCVLVPLLFVAFGFLLGILLALLYALADLF